MLKRAACMWVRHQWGWQIPCKLKAFLWTFFSSKSRMMRHLSLIIGVGRYLTILKWLINKGLVCEKMTKTLRPTVFIWVVFKGWGHRWPHPNKYTTNISQCTKLTIWLKFLWMHYAIKFKKKSFRYTAFLYHLKHFPPNATSFDIFHQH